MDIIYGCDCKCNNHSEDSENTPCAFLIERDGKEMKVCTKCDLTSDKKIALLFDENTDLEPFLRNDALGALCMVGMIANKLGK